MSTSKKNPDNLVIVVRKPNRSIHQTPFENEAKIRAISNRLPVGQKWIIEKMPKDQADLLGSVDRSFVAPHEAGLQVKKLEGALSEKSAEIERLQKILSGLQGGANVSDLPPAPPVTGNENTGAAIVEGQNNAPGGGPNSELNKMLAADVVTMINEAKTPDEVQALASGDGRITVQNAAVKKMESFNK